jgi:hypothetical protein
LFHLLLIKHFVLQVINLVAIEKILDLSPVLIEFLSVVLPVSLVIHQEYKIYYNYIQKTKKMQKKLIEIKLIFENTPRPFGRGVLIFKNVKKTNRNQLFCHI